MAELRPNCPLKMQELINREVKDTRHGIDINAKSIKNKRDSINGLTSA